MELLFITKSNIGCFDVEILGKDSFARFEIQGLQAHTVIFDSQITGTGNAIFSSLRTFLKSVQKHNLHTTISYFES